MIHQQMLRDREGYLPLRREGSPPMDLASCLPMGLASYHPMVLVSAKDRLSNLLGLYLELMS